MARKVVWASAAWADVEQIAEFIARDSPRYAAAFVREIRTAAASLKRFAELGRTVPEFHSPQIRELIVGSYRLIYRVAESRVEVLAVIHGARDLLRAWARRTGDA